MNWISIKDKQPPKGSAFKAKCDDGKIRTLWRCGCNSQWCEMYLDASQGDHISVEIIEWKLR